MLRVARRLLSVSARRGQATGKMYEGAGSVFIVQEAYSKWERRVPLCPEHVERLVKEEGLRVVVEKSSKRVFPDADYEKAGAVMVDRKERIAEWGEDAGLVLGVKQIPVERVREEQEGQGGGGRNYVFFSHVIKAQKENMELLDTLVGSGARLFDYECITEGGVPKAKRLVAFGRFAGIAGMVDILQGVGQRLLAAGLSTPFLNCPVTYTFHDLEAAKEGMRSVGSSIQQQRIPDELQPLVFTFAGMGNVSQGAQEMFTLLPHEWVDVRDLPQLEADVRAGKRPEAAHTLYGVRIDAEHVVVRKDGGQDQGAFDYPHYFANPDEYQPVFHSHIAPYTSVLVNCMYWDQKYPRLLTKEQMSELWNRPDGTGRKLFALSDISCDVNGAVEFFSRESVPDRPFYMYDPAIDRTYDDIDDRGILVQGVSILPAELPRDSSKFFGDALMPFIPALARSTGSATQDDMFASEGLPPELLGCCIASHGELTPAFRYITDLRRERDTMEAEDTAASADRIKGSSTGSGAPRRPSSPAPRIHKTALVVGSGMVTKPLIDHLAHTVGCDVLVATNMEYDPPAGLESRVTRVALNVTEDARKLQELVERSDVVLSMLPAPLHPHVARACLDTRTPLVTSSYVSPDMAALHQEAQERGVPLLNELGLDPGIDHMLAMKMIHDIQGRGGRVDKFTSLCGGLPAPDSADNPLLYKFSWSPRAVLTAAQNAAVFRADATEQRVTSEDLLASAEPIDAFATLKLEVLPNRDSLKYGDIYGIADASKLYRGTLRYQGWSNIMYGLRTLGLFAMDTSLDLNDTTTWGDLIRAGTGRAADGQPLSMAAILSASDADVADPDAVLSAVEWLGLSPENAILSHPRLASVKDSLQGTTQSILDISCALLTGMLSMEPRDRDMVAMLTEIEGHFQDGAVEKHRCTLVQIGSEESTAMADTVGTPAAIVAELLVTGQLVLDGGVFTPTQPDIYNPVLQKLHAAGISAKFSSTRT